MIVFADTSGLFAFLVRDDFMHGRARTIFQSFAKSDTRLLTSSYVLVETTALLQRRVGIDAVHEFNFTLLPLLDVVWVDEYWHERAVNRLITSGQKKLSVVDCLSFIIMESRDIRTAFSFDTHFEKNGFLLAR
ncbi:MAG: PIN domain-containing protein [Desulfofustis sp. PB-SRB1]|jgi:predicted nucleic acid-binding protein|nr:PIN domain-containing protein [Desulfofustis sp. PB-SRB1]MBM1002721.1 PIN domain-containing protein [Desulfofustis sp. PB-SRB1]HBH27240.1 PIN domain-containing protein [Desulfofustis sp.]HBH31167.1 PIN domain-containing protein [Desulfofustis sp.]